MRLLRYAGAWCALMVCASNALALDIVLTNDDGMESVLTYAAYEQLKTAGHRVLIAAPASDQSGRGGALDIMRPMTDLPKGTRGGCVLASTPPAPAIGNLAMGAPWIDPACPSDPNVYWIDTTPAGSALYGIDVAALERFGRAPDLVVSGPNFGGNTGFITNTSGTVNAALMAINRGVPAVAVSAAEPMTYRSLRTGVTDADRELAGIVVRLVAALERNRSHDRQGMALPLMSAGSGLNVNVPKFKPGTASTLEYRLTDIGVHSLGTPVYTTDLCGDSTMRVYMGKVCADAPRLSGLGFVIDGKPMPAGLSSLPETDPQAEQAAVNAGAIAVSVMQGTHQAQPAQKGRVARQLRGLVK
jgi:5'-nucleotidase